MIRWVVRVTVPLAAMLPQLAGAQAKASVEFWQSDGYGYVIALTDSTLQIYEVTESTCLKQGEARREKSGEGPGAVSYSRDGRVLQVHPGRNANQRRLHVDGAASDVVVNRIGGLPTRCAQPLPGTPENVFEVFTSTWREHYILFDEKHVDWEHVVAEARPKVTSSMQPTELFDLLSGMIAPFEDAHTSLSAPDLKRRFGKVKTGSDRVMKHQGNEFLEKDLPSLFAATEHRLAGALRSFCNGKLQYSTFGDSIGYLRILGEGGYTREGGFASGLVALEAALDTIFREPPRGLVIDVRVNFGGADPYGLALASRLTSSPYIAYTKAARNDPRDHHKYTEGQPSRVLPSSRPHFYGPVVELTGPLTISAGETTTQALMGRRPHVVRIGENTQGVFSDVLGRHLPNGWSFGLPNEVFRTADGKTFDGPGIPPDIAVPVFADDDVAAGRDPAIERALAILRKQ